MNLKKVILTLSIMSMLVSPFTVMAAGNNVPTTTVAGEASVSASEDPEATQEEGLLDETHNNNDEATNKILEEMSDDLKENTDEIFEAKEEQITENIMESVKDLSTPITTDSNSTRWVPDQSRTCTKKFKLSGNETKKFEFFYTANCNQAPEITFLAPSGEILRVGEDSITDTFGFISRINYPVTGFNDLRVSHVYLTTLDDFASGTWTMSYYIDESIREFIVKEAKAEDGWVDFTEDYRSAPIQVISWYLDFENSPFEVKNIRDICSRDRSVPESNFLTEHIEQPKEARDFTDIILLGFIVAILATIILVVFLIYRIDGAYKEKRDYEIRQENKNLKIKKRKDNEKLGTYMDPYSTMYTDDEVDAMSYTVDYHMVEEEKHFVPSMDIKEGQKIKAVAPVRKKVKPVPEETAKESTKDAAEGITEEVVKDVAVAGVAVAAAGVAIGEAASNIIEEGEDVFNTMPSDAPAEDTNKKKVRTKKEKKVKEKKKGPKERKPREKRVKGYKAVPVGVDTISENKNPVEETADEPITEEINNSDKKEKKTKEKKSFSLFGKKKNKKNENEEKIPEENPVSENNKEESEPLLDGGFSDAVEETENTSDESVKAEEGKPESENITLEEEVTRSLKEKDESPEEDVVVAVEEPAADKNPSFQFSFGSTVSEEDDYSDETNETFFNPIEEPSGEAVVEESSNTEETPVEDKSAKDKILNEVNKAKDTAKSGIELLSKEASFLSSMADELVFNKKERAKDETGESSYYLKNFPEDAKAIDEEERLKEEALKRKEEEGKLKESAFEKDSFLAATEEKPAFDIVNSINESLLPQKTDENEEKSEEPVKEEVVKKSIPAWQITASNDTEDDDDDDELYIF